MDRLRDQYPQAREAAGLGPIRLVSTSLADAARYGQSIGKTRSSLRIIGLIDRIRTISAR